MMDRVRYYLDILASVCGFDGQAGNSVVGWFVIALAFLIVVYAFYLAITRMIFPNEENKSHIKFRILEEGDTRFDGGDRYAR